MKSTYLLIAFVIFTGHSFSQTVFPKKMPNDFKIEYRSVGAMSTGDRTIILQKGECKDVTEGWEEPESNYSYTLHVGKKNLKQLRALYTALTKLNAFSLKMDGPFEESYPGEGITYTLNGKKYQSGNYASVGIMESDRDAYNQSVSLIIQFVQALPKSEIF